MGWAPRCWEQPRPPPREPVLTWPATAEPSPGVSEVKPPYGPTRYGAPGCPVNNEILYVRLLVLENKEIRISWK